MLLLALALVAGQPFTCRVISVHDGDGPFHCADGVSIRLAGVQAPDFEVSEPCRRGRSEFVCSNKLAKESRDRMAELIQGRTLDCLAAGKSYKRTVARCRLNGVDLSCLAIRRGIATRWAKFDPRGLLISCDAPEEETGAGRALRRLGYRDAQNVLSQENSRP
jgi:endonuclease YncB( thermonuclease family)